MSVGLYDTGACPLGHRCESCGADGEDLAVVAASTPLGVLCLTMCPRCAGSGVAPPVAVGTAARLVGQHAVHLGIDLDEMAETMRHEEGGR